MKWAKQLWIALTKTLRNMRTLSTEAQQVLHAYLQLPFTNKQVNAPYFNNQRSNVRGGLRALIGKGTPADIAEEAELIALREKITLSSLSDEQLKKFLVDHNLGVDCSALAYYTLAAELKARKNSDLKNNLFFPHAKNFVRRLLTRLRPAENVNVTVLGDDHNSAPVSLTHVQPGDLIILWQTGPEKKLNHVLVVHEVDGISIHYTHSFRWSKEGQYEHGARTGTITITDPAKSLLEQTWTEKKYQNSDNDTFKHAQAAAKLELRRLKILS